MSWLQWLRADLKDARWMFLKAALFLVIGFGAAIGLYLENPGFRTLLLLGFCVWGFARFYYFTFFVVQNYVDADYKFSGLIGFGVYLWRKKRAG